jgi:choline dehydrogenase-like flavoprotein
VRGSTQDYDDWAELSGDPSWSASEMKKYMKRHQTLEPISAKVADRTPYPFAGENHGSSGPIHTSTYPGPHPLAAILMFPGFNDNALPIENDVILGADSACGFSKKPKDPWSGDHIGFVGRSASSLSSS